MADNQRLAFEEELNTLLDKYGLKMTAEYQSWNDDDGDRETDLAIQLKDRNGYTFTYFQE